MSTRTNWCDSLVAGFLLASTGLLIAPAAGQVSLPTGAVRAFAANVIVPQSRAYSTVDRRGAVELTGVEAGIVVLEQTATTTLDLSLTNPTGARLEAELLVPVPDGATVKGVTFQGSASEPTAALLPKDEARRTYDGIAAKLRDPALLEFAGYNLIRSSVFPVEAHGSQKVRLTYEQLLPADANRIDYFLPRSESLEYKVPWQITVKIKSRRPVSTVYSPSHQIDTRRTSDGVVAVRVADNAQKDPGPFRLSYLLEQKEGVSASLLAYPGPKSGEGYFLLLAGTPSAPKEAKSAIQREVVLVFDRSGSMQGEKIEQVREAALQIIAGLEEGESFNIIAYNEAIESFSPEPVIKSDESVKAAREYLKRVNARGGTNLHDALLEALRQKPRKDFLPIVLFLTDGLPTIGQTSEVAIRNVAIESNPYQRRVFTFGVGVDVNTPLLEKIASETRAKATFILPKEDVEVKVSSIYNRLAGPVLADPKLEILESSGKPAIGRVMDLLPSRLPDLFEGDQVVLLGRYSGDQPLTFQITGNYRGKPRSFRFVFEFDKATVQHAFVPRLWASRKIGILVDAIRQAGADAGPSSVLSRGPDPKIKELVDEIVRLSTEFGILTEYTAFLAREGTDLSRKDAVLQQANGNFQSRAMQTRSGAGSINQSFNGMAQQSQTRMNYRNDYYDENLQRVEVSQVQQVNDRAFYNRNGRWVDSRLVTNASVEPRRVIEFGSEDYRRLTERLAAEGRQGTISLRGEILMEVDNETILVR